MSSTKLMLVIGATPYFGGRLLPRLVEYDGRSGLVGVETSRVRCAVRTVGAVSGAARLEGRVDAALFRSAPTRVGVRGNSRSVAGNRSDASGILTGLPPLNSAKSSSVGFLISDQQEGRFKLEVAWIKTPARVVK